MVSRTEEEKTHSGSAVAEAEATGAKMHLLTVSPGKLGLTVKVDRILGGCTITAIALTCTFKDHVETGDRLVTIDGQKITQIADLQINNTKIRKFGIVKKIVTDSEQSKQQAPPPSSSSQTAAVNSATTTPIPKNTTGNPIVTTEKSTCTKNNAANNKGGEDEDNNIQVLINCPDGSVINLSSDQTNNDFPSHIVLGRGQHGIPSSSLAVLPQACALRIVEKCCDDDDDVEVSKNNSDDVPNSRKKRRFALELVALGMERCTVLRDGNAQYVTSIAQILTSGKDTVTCTSSIIIRNGDIIEPCDREKATVNNNSVHYEFKVEIVSGASPTITGGREDAAVGDGSSAFAMASRKINEAATMGGDNDEKKRQDNSSSVAPGNPYAKRPDLTSANPYANSSKKLAANPYAVQKAMSTNPYAISSEKTASNPHNVKDNAEAMVVHNPFDFDKESLRKAFLLEPNSTANFFYAYHKVLSEKKSTNNANTELGNNVLNVFIDAMSPQDNTSPHESMTLHGKLEQFPLKDILEIAVDGKHMELGKRAIEGYVWLSCQNIAKKPSGIDPPSGPTLLANSDFPLAKMCNKIGWGMLEAVLVESIELLCKYQKTSFKAFSLVEMVEPTQLSTSANSRVFFRMAKVAYERYFTADPEATANHFIGYHRRVVKRSYDASVKLINAFVDAMSPSDSASRRAPMKAFDSYFPLDGILATIIVDGRHMELGKRVLEGYVWLSSQKVSNERYSSSASKPRGPEVLAGGSFNLVSVCDKIGWSLLGDVLVDAIEKLCEFDNTARAFELMKRITGASSRGGNSQCSLVCVRMAKATSKEILNAERFHANPTATAKLFVTQYKNLEKESSNKEFCVSLLNSFVDVLSPRDRESRKVPAMPLFSDFPLNDILTPLVNGGHICTC